MKLKLTHWSQVHAVDPFLFSDDPKVGFPIADYPADVTGWNSDDKAFNDLILEVKPQLIVEVGVWKGASAIHQANLLKKHGLNDSRLMAVDTWLGSLEFWTRRDDPERYQALKCEFGYPTVYRQFIANVIHAGMQDVIIPFPNTSHIGALWVKDAGFEADLIYLDSSHDYHDVVNDIRDWWVNLRPGGVMFGDDYSSFLGVRLAFEHVSSVINCDPSVCGNKWVMRKPLADSAGGE